MGVGVCANATCKCFEGYAGQYCEQCAPGYTLSARGTCAPSSDPCQSDVPTCTTSTDCSSRGECVNTTTPPNVNATSTCVCELGAFGRQCADVGCPEEWSAAECACCPSGVFSLVGDCCDVTVPGTQPVLDINGACCASGHVDACGAPPSCDPFLTSASCERCNCNLRNAPHAQLRQADEAQPSVYRSLTSARHFLNFKRLCNRAAAQTTGAAGRTGVRRVGNGSSFSEGAPAVR